MRETSGFGLDPKAADIDGDGDIDLVASDRSGLYLLENLLKSDPEQTSDVLPPSSEEGPWTKEDHRNVLLYVDENNETKTVSSLKEWAFAAPTSSKDDGRDGHSPVRSIACRSISKSSPKR